MLCWSAKYLISSVLGLQETIVITFASPPERCMAAGKIPGLACIKGLVGLGSLLGGIITESHLNVDLGSRLE